MSDTPPDALALLAEALLETMPEQPGMYCFPLLIGEATDLAYLCSQSPSGARLLAALRDGLAVEALPTGWVVERLMTAWIVYPDSVSLPGYRALTLTAAIDAALASRDPEAGK